MLTGFGKVLAQDDENREKRKSAAQSRGVFLKEFDIWRDESRIVYFSGDILDEPHSLPYHTIKLPPWQEGGNDRFEKEICCLPFIERRENEAKESIRGLYLEYISEPRLGCLYCHRRTKAIGDKRVGPPSARYVITLTDTTVVHKVPNVVGEKTYINDRVCGGDTCQHCGDPNEEVSAVHYVGGCYAALNSKTAAQLSGQISEISAFCASCWKDGAAMGTAKVRHEGWTCNSCDGDADIEDIKTDTVKGTPFYAEGSLTVCPHCGVDGDEGQSFRERVVCLGKRPCAEPRRVRTNDGLWRVTKSGSGTESSMVFAFMGVQDLSNNEDYGWVVAEESLTQKMKRFLRPRPSAMAANQLGLTSEENPFLDEDPNARYFEDEKRSGHNRSSGGQRSTPRPGGNRPQGRPSGGPRQNTAAQSYDNDDDGLPYSGG